VVVEVIQAERGVKTCDVAFLKALREKCDEHCALLVFDEIQTGFGRTGSLFAFQQVGVVPDVLVLGKALGGGMPMGGFIASKSLMSQFSYNPILGHITTFGGHPVVCAAGDAAFDVLLSEISMDDVLRKGAMFKDGLKHSMVQNIHGTGLMLAVELDSFELVQNCIQKMLDRGLFSDWFLYAPNCLRLSPPLTITEEEIQWACEAIVEVFKEMCE
jgi:acetylornithine/N-succinyldiaminopimelate aminotransferase